jgi:epoxyqueuosine reductase
MKNLTRRIKEQAREIGFDLVGITSAKPLLEARKILKERNINGNLALLTTPGLHLPGARSIISLAISYASSREFKEDASIALYARSRDYHIVLKEKMEFIINYIKKLEPEVRFRAYTDTGNILEREIARRAGLGWIGRNNNLLNPEYGSYLFLAEIITDLDLDLDREMTGDCGNCQLCVDNCPGKALKPYYLEPEKCISYLTQKRGFLSLSNREKIGNNLWGCDACLSICPYNRNIPLDLHPEFTPVLRGDLETILNMDNLNNQVWQQSALAWRGLRTLKRNALINIGNSRNDRFMPLLNRELKSPSPILREYAAWAIKQLDPENATKNLRER